MANENSYTTLAGVGRAEFEEKKSVFIGSAAHAPTEADAIDFVKKIRSEFSDARHNVYAYVTDGGRTARFSDDGEPKGTGGLPVLEVIKKSGCVDACVVVTRYFGGILLGTGGLTRAYTEGAKIALEAAGVVTYELYEEYTLSCSYSEYDKVVSELAKFDVIFDSTDFAEGVSVRFAVKKEFSPLLAEKMNELFSGRAACVLTGERYDGKK